MEMIKTPAGFVSAFNTQFCVLAGCDPAQYIPVEVFRQGAAQPSGSKRVHGQQGYQVDVAAYLPAMLDPAPEGSTGMVEKQKAATRVYVKAGVAVSQPFVACASREELSAMEILSGGPAVRVLRPGERDEMAVAARGVSLSGRIVFPSGGDKELGCVEVAGGIAALAVSYGDFDGSERASLVVECGGLPIAVREYMMGDKNPDGVRLAWLNRFGAIDAYTFNMVSQSTSTEGFLKKQLTTVASAIEPLAVRVWLGEILSAPRVWAWDGVRYNPVVVSSGAVAVKGDRPCRVEVTFSPAVSEEIPFLPW